MIYKKLLNTENEENVLFDICLPCYESTDKLNETIINLVESEYKVTLPVKFIISIEKQSVAANRLACLEHSKADYVMHCDDDFSMTKVGWDQYLYNKIKNNPSIGVIGINIVHHKMLYQIAHPSRQDGECIGVCGCVMMTRKVPEIVPDKNYIASQIEDTDLCFQYRNKGYKVIQDNSLYAIHKNEERNRDYSFNGVYFDKKWNTNMFRGMT